MSSNKVDAPISVAAQNPQSLAAASPQTPTMTRLQELAARAQARKDADRRLAESQARLQTAELTVSISHHAEGVAQSLKDTSKLTAGIQPKNPSYQARDAQQKLTLGNPSPISVR